MNTFANSLFTMLFSWAKRLIRHAWDDTVSGQFSSFFIWLGDHWVWVALGLIIGCTVVDYLIWLIRWRPYLLWRAFFRRVGRFFRGHSRQFEQGYDSSVDIRLTPEQETAAQAEEALQALIREFMPYASPHERFLLRTGRKGNLLLAEVEIDTDHHLRYGTCANLWEGVYRTSGGGGAPGDKLRRAAAAIPGAFAAVRRTKRGLALTLGLPEING